MNTVANPFSVVDSSTFATVLGTQPSNIFLSFWSFFPNDADSSAQNTSVGLFEL